MFDFLKLRESVAGLGVQLTAVRRQIEETKQQIESVIYAPAHPDDILTAATKWIKKKEAKYEDHFVDRIFNNFKNKPGRFETEEFYNDDLRYSVVSGDASDIFFIGLIGAERIISIFKEHIAKIPATEHGLRNAERGPALAELEKKMQKLRAEESKLVKGAADAGLSIQ